ncbi:hypothetical protein RK21_02817 [Pseudomonas plecoglossicida]|nr:hypothetical protein RK21_02817 [Pseudomonas plecoglossicida]
MDFELEYRLEYCEKYSWPNDGQIGRQLSGDPCSKHSH